MVPPCTLRPMPGTRPRVLCVEGTGTCDGGAQMMLDELLHRIDGARFEVSVAFLEDGSWPERLRYGGLRRLGAAPDPLAGRGERPRRHRRTGRTGPGPKDIDLVHASGNSPLLYA